MSIHSAQALPLPRQVAGRQIGRQSVSSILVSRWLRTLAVWIDRSHQRRQLGELAELNDHLLRDIGVSREEALREAAKWFWR